ncbi:BrnA antitoxin family protein [Sphingobium naphthae]|uniref:Uncharacterized protein n=1 Tax=Sphingobium naphthae TaxID=1886786 RepID=A0ABU4A232_9SPHN|nr:BrnA antitoxin family protein [Sphingobium naphthae]MDV5825805.1 hypothetical protein [Sphingobium naphthae]
MTDAQKAELAAKPDSEIEFSDISPLAESFWQNAERSRFYKPIKQITARVDTDVLAWLKSQGKISGTDQRDPPPPNALVDPALAYFLTGAA